MQNKNIKRGDIYMKLFIHFSFLLSILPLSATAQDDLYFIPNDGTNKNMQEVVIDKNDGAPTYYSGINKSDMEYNHRGKFRSSYQKIGKDSLGNDIIQFEIGNGKYGETDTVYQVECYYNSDEDVFAYSRRMGRFEGFWGYYSPWRIGSPYYYSAWGYWDPWYSDFYGPWLGYGYGWGGYYGWYNPWRYGYYGWGSPYYYGGWYPYGYSWRPNYSYRGAFGHTGTANHWANGRVFNNRNVAGYRGNGNTNRDFQSYDNTRVRSSRFGGSRGVTNGNFGGSRNNSTRFNNTRSYTPNRSSFGSGTRSSYGGGSFGGSRGGGATRSGGGGRFGGHR